MKLFVLLSLVALAQSVPVDPEDSVLRLVVGNFVNCMNSDLSLCLKENALKATERIATVRQLKLIDGVTIINNGQRKDRSLDLSTDPETRKRQVAEKLWESTQSLIQNSDLELSYDTESGEDESRAIGDVVEGRDKKKKAIKKKIKMLLPLAIIAKIKAIALVVLFLGVIAASIYKLAVLAKIAFIAKVFAIIKALIAKKHASQEQGWIAHEEHGGHGDHGWEGGWSRSRNDGSHNLAYSAYKN